MQIGILGPGRVGGGLGRLWGVAGHDVLYAYSRTRGRLDAAAAATAGRARVGSPAEAVACGEVVVLTTPWWVVPDALAAAGAFGGRVLLDATNPYTRGWAGHDALPPGRSAAELVADWVPAARVVKAFNTVPAVVLAAALARQQGARDAGSDAARGAPAGASADAWPATYSGDDPAALALVGGLIEP